ncbi:HNH endonuclease [Streptomyces sp. NPDC048254]|uniref:HNH endonuclease n=1 Tax=Streptomyces sp. NPDC048254 TaxID=3365525 RepID=UPI003717FA0C
MLSLEVAFVAVPVSQQRKLSQRSGNICAFPGCGLLLTAEGTPEEPVVVLGEMAHIVAESPNGPRGDSPLTTEERNRYENLILLCNQHHQLIDSDGALAMYTVERLQAMKEDHEKRVERRLGGRPNVKADLPPMVNSTVHSNVLPVTQMPRHVYGAPCLVDRESEVRPEGTSTGVMTPFILREGRLWAFQNLRDESGPFAAFVDRSATERFDSREWWADPDKLQWYVALLNRSLNKLTGRLGLRLDRNHHRYYFEPEEEGVQRTVVYRPLNTNKATRSVVWQPKKKATGEARNYWLHRAVSLRFFLIGNSQWCLSIRPELRVTSDGFESIDAKHVGRQVTRKKARLFNYDLLAEVQFWRDFLGKSSPRISFPFGDGQSLVISTSLSSGQVRWPGIPPEHDMPFKNVEYVDDLFTWAEAESLSEDDALDHEQDEEAGYEGVIVD